MRYPASEKVEIIRLVEQSHLPVRRTLEQIGVSRAHFLPLVRSLSDRRAGGAGGPALAAEPRLEPYPGRHPAADPGARPGGDGAVTPRAGGALHRHHRLFRIGSNGLPPAQGPRPDHQPGLHRDEGSQRVHRQDHPAERDVADRLHLSEDHRLGVDVPVDHPRRLLALHHRLEAVHDDEGGGRHRHAGTGAGGLRLRPGACPPQAAPAVGQRLELHRRRSRRLARRPGR